MATTSLNPHQRRSDLARLAEEEIDVLVVGGGVTGAGTALDAATRGLSVALVEAEDWASATSSNSSRLIHGGLRYLEMFDFALVHEALRERGLLLDRIAPHLVTRIPFLYPLRHHVWERAYVTCGVTLYDLLAWSTKNTGGVPHHSQLSRRQALRLAPALRSDSLVGALLYYDAHADDARLVLDLARTAAGYGALAVNRVRLTGLAESGERITGAALTDMETGDELRVRARSVVVATGPWTEETETLAGRERPLRLRPAKGVHIVVPKEVIPSSAAMIVPTEKSVLFVLPWANHWMIGTTDTEWPYGPDDVVASQADVDYLLGHVNAVLDERIAADQVQAVFAGLRPLVAGAGESTTKLSREHAVGRPRPGLVVISGGKYTTYRVMARDAIDAAVAEWPGSVAPSCTHAVELAGASGFEAGWNQRFSLAARHGLDPPAVEHLLHRHGTLADQVLTIADDDPDLRLRLDPVEPYIRAEVVHAVRHEGALHLDDVLRRRTRLATEAPNGAIEFSLDAARLMGRELGWTEAAIRSEVERYRRRVELEQEAVGQPDDRSAHAVMAQGTPPSSLGALAG